MHGQSINQCQSLMDDLPRSIRIRRIFKYRHENKLLIPFDLTAKTLNYYKQKSNGKVKKPAIKQQKNRNSPQYARSINQSTQPMSDLPVKIRGHFLAGSIFPQPRQKLQNKMQSTRMSGEMMLVIKKIWGETIQPRHTLMDTLEAAVADAVSHWHLKANNRLPFPEHLTISQTTKHGQCSAPHRSIDFHQSSRRCCSCAPNWADDGGCGRALSGIDSKTRATATQSINRSINRLN